MAKDYYADWNKDTGSISWIGEWQSKEYNGSNYDQVSVAIPGDGGEEFKYRFFFKEDAQKRKKIDGLAETGEKFNFNWRSGKYGDDIAIDFFKEFPNEFGKNSSGGRSGGGDSRSSGGGSRSSGGDSRSSGDGGESRSSGGGGGSSNANSNGSYDIEASDREHYWKKLKPAMDKKNLEVRIIDNLHRRFDSYHNTVIEQYVKVLLVGADPVPTRDELAEVISAATKFALKTWPSVQGKTSYNKPKPAPEPEPEPENEVDAILGDIPYA